LRLGRTCGSERTIAPMRSSYLVCYDISDDKRLRRVFKTMRAWGDHIQFSVFECQLTSADLVRLRANLSGIIHHNEDQVLFVLLGPAEGRGERVITALGKPYTPSPGAPRPPSTFACTNASSTPERGPSPPVRDGRAVRKPRPWSELELQSAHLDLRFLT